MRNSRQPAFDQIGVARAPMEIISMDKTGASPEVTDASVPTASMARIVLDMLGRADRAIDIDPRQARVFIDQASRLLEPAPKPSGGRSWPSLAPWQERKILIHIGRHVGQTVRNEELARVAGLSVGHFARCFKGSFGVSPRGYVIRTRLERAKILMRETQTPLSQIALDSGFADQAHMSRLFHAIIGDTPTRWRRAQTPEFQRT